MPGRNVIDVTTVTVAVSGTVGEPSFGLSGARSVAVFVPVVTSADLSLRGSFNQTSANFVPVLNPLVVTSATWKAGVGPGSVAAVVPQDVFEGLAEAKLELSVPQAAARTLIVVTKW